jgi:hypothetical protein
MKINHDDQKIYSSFKKDKIVKIFIILNILLYLVYFYAFQKSYLQNANLFFGPQDRFADFIKTIFSFNHIFTEKELLSLGLPEPWIYYNPYSVIREWSTTILMATPPLMFMLYLLSSYLAKAIGLNYLVLYIILSLVLLGIIFYIFRKELVDNKKYIFILLSFPTIFLFDRGNLLAALTALFLFYLIKKFISNRKYNYYDVIIFVLMASIRPNYIFFGLIFTFNKNFKDSLIEFVKIFSTYILSNLLFIFISSNLYPFYSGAKFLYSFREYSFLYESPWNSSAYGFIKNIFNLIVDKEVKIINILDIDFLSRVINSTKFIYLIVFIYLLLVIFIYFYLQNKNINKLNFILILLSAFTLFTHPVTDYHLIIFVFIFILVLNSFDGGNLIVNCILLSLILLPKLYFYSPSFNVANAVNFFALNLLIIYNFFCIKKEIKNSEFVSL